MLPPLLLLLLLLVLLLLLSARALHDGLATELTEDTRAPISPLMIRQLSISRLRRRQSVARPRRACVYLDCCNGLLECIVVDPRGWWPK